MRGWEVAVEQSRDLCCLSAETDMFVVSPDNKHEHESTWTIGRMWKLESNSWTLSQ